MQLAAVLLARVAILSQLEDLNPRGRVLFPDITKDLLQRYQFLKVPQTWEDYNNPQAGIMYLQGKWAGLAIDKLQLFPWGIVVETRSSTDDSERFLHEALTWAAETYGLTYEPEKMKRRVYMSQLTFTSEADLEALHPKLKDFNEQLEKTVSPSLGQPLHFRTYGITFSFEMSVSEPPMVVPVHIERRAGVPFSENKYFSSAPLSTNAHLKFLADFEAALLQSSKRY